MAHQMENSFLGNHDCVWAVLHSTPTMTRRRFHRTMEMIPARVRYDTELPPFISIVWYPGRPVILGMDKLMRATGAGGGGFGFAVPHLLTMNQVSSLSDVIEGAAPDPLTYPLRRPFRRPKTPLW